MPAAASSSANAADAPTSTVETRCVSVEVAIAS